MGTSINVFVANFASAYFPKPVFSVPVSSRCVMYVVMYNTYVKGASDRQNAMHSDRQMQINVTATVSGDVEFAARPNAVGRVGRKGNEGRRYIFNNFLCNSYSLLRRNNGSIDSNPGRSMKRSRDQTNPFFIDPFSILLVDRRKFHQKRIKKKERERKGKIFYKRQKYISFVRL